MTVLAYGALVDSSGPNTWFNIMQCVSTELFPTFSVKISECLEQKVLRDSAFQMSDVGEDAVNDIIFHLKRKRTMNNKEITYLRKLIQRAVNLPQVEHS